MPTSICGTCGLSTVKWHGYSDRAAFTSSSVITRTSSWPLEYRPHFDRGNVELVAIETYVRLLSDHVAAACAAGLSLIEMHELLVDDRWIVLNRSFRDEALDAYLFDGLDQVRDIAETSRFR